MCVYTVLRTATSVHTQRTIKEYERLAQPAQAGQGKARTQTAKEDTVSNKRSGPRRVLKR